jgi:hypothetical protein
MNTKLTPTLLTLLSACLYVPGAVDASEATTKSIHQSAVGCEFSQVSFKADFETARLNNCEALDDGSYLLTTDPENRPINPSPWYAFTVNSKEDLSGKNQPHKVVTIIIAAGEDKPRYIPKMQMPNGKWQALDFDMTPAGLRLSLQLNEAPIKIAAQAIINNGDYDTWSDDFADHGDFEKINIGKSTQGRSIFALVNQHPKNHEWLVLIGRQHPPELTGAMAMLSFADSINAGVSNSTPALKAFYNRFNVLIVPNVNPDGVASGNWRHNTKGADLNRDWGKFKQVETSVVNAYMESLLSKTGSQTPKLVFAVDFHSTQQDIFYTMPNDYSVAPADFSDRWLANVKANTISSFVIRNRPGISPGRGVFKQYIADTYYVHAVTYEMGDNTPQSLIDHVAKASANELVKHMLATPPADFYYTEATD